MSALLDAIAQSHTVVVRAWLIDGDIETELETVIDGEVTLDAGAASRGAMSLTIATNGDLGLVPDSPSSPLAPYGNEIRLERGAVLPSGDELVAPLGVYRIDDATVEDAAGGLTVRLAGLDRSARIIDARFEEPYQVAAGTNYATAIADAITAVYPDVQTNLTATSRTTPSLLAEEGDDRWEFCQRMATAIGMTLYFDADGVLVLEPATLPGGGSPAWTVAEGADGVLLSASRQWSRQGAYNRVIATGENTTQATPARGVATDDNPLSPTYYYGAFGRVPRFYVSRFITTDEQAEDAAAAILARELGTTQRISLGALVNPSLKPGVVIRVTRALSGIDEDHVVDRVTIPLTVAQPMTVQTRAVQVTA